VADLVTPEGGDDDDFRWRDSESMPTLQVAKAAVRRVRKTAVVRLSPDERVAPRNRSRHYSRGQRARPNTTAMPDPTGAQGWG
jgi:hypothetical protein